jgi:hypothetical protein
VAKLGLIITIFERASAVIYTSNHIPYRQKIAALEE